MRKAIKIITNVIAFIAILAGFFGFFASMGSGAKQVDRFYKQRPLHEINGIAIDQKGNLYYGSLLYSVIQVYDNNGDFLYGFSFPSDFSGSSCFYIDKDDFIHVATTFNERTYTFLYGEIVETGEYKDYDEYKEFRRLGSIREKFQDEYGNTYIIRGRNVDLYSETDIYIRTIKPNAPIWPFSVGVFWGIAVLGGATLVIVNRKLLKKTFNFDSGLFRNIRPTERSIKHRKL